MNQINRTAGMANQTDLGLKSFMLGTYRYMTLAMAVTASVSFIMAQYFLANPAAFALIANPIVSLVLMLVIMFGFGAIGKKLPSMSLGGVLTFLFGFAALMGVFTSYIGMFYNPLIIAKIFFMTVALFGALSIFGYTTERNLGTIVKYAFAAFLVFIVVKFVGAFVPALAVTGMADTVITAVALIAISVMVAWETQLLKQIYYGSAGNPAMMQKLSAFGAASLLLSFINMFSLLLSLFGDE